MATEVKVPTLGESITEATLGEWLKKPGDAVAADEPIASLDFLGFGPQVAYDPFALLNNGTYILTSIESSDLP